MHLPQNILRNEFIRRFALLHSIADPAPTKLIVACIGHASPISGPASSRRLAGVSSNAWRCSLRHAQARDQEEKRPARPVGLPRSLCKLLLCKPLLCKRRAMTHVRTTRPGVRSAFRRAGRSVTGMRWWMVGKLCTRRETPLAELASVSQTSVLLPIAREMAIPWATLLSLKSEVGREMWQTCRLKLGCGLAAEASRPHRRLVHSLQWPQRTDHVGGVDCVKVPLVLSQNLVCAGSGTERLCNFRSRQRGVASCVTVWTEAYHRLSSFTRETKHEQKALCTVLLPSQQHFSFLLSASPALPGVKTGFPE